MSDLLKRWIRPMAIILFLAVCATNASVANAQPGPKSTFPPAAGANVMLLNDDGSFHYLIYNINATSFLDINTVYVGRGTDLSGPTFQWAGAVETSQNGVFLLMVAGGPIYTMKQPMGGGLITWKNDQGGSGVLIIL